VRNTQLITVSEKSLHERGWVGQPPWRERVVFNVALITPIVMEEGLRFLL
jgi:hypothetical protein